MMTKMVLPSPADELVGFIPYRPNIKIDDEIAIVLTLTYIRLNDRAMVELGKPEWINVFLDYNKKRLMVTASEKGRENAIRVGAMAKANKRNVINTAGLRKEIELMVGKAKQTRQIIGHKVETGNPTIIFNLAEKS